jgi:hypothetical protein
MKSARPEAGLGVSNYRETIATMLVYFSYFFPRRCFQPPLPPPPPSLSLSGSARCGVKTAEKKIHACATGKEITLASFRSTNDAIAVSRANKVTVFGSEQLR